jgi:hypothetical protein
MTDHIYNVYVAAGLIEEQAFAAVQNVTQRLIAADYRELDEIFTCPVTIESLFDPTAHYENTPYDFVQVEKTRNP